LPEGSTATELPASKLAPPKLSADTVCPPLWILAEQLAVVPPLDPVQLHVQGPLPLTVVAVPALQRLVVGAEVNVPPFEEPQEPFTAVAENVAVTEQALVTGAVV